MYVVVQFLSFVLYHYHTLPYTKTKKMKIKPKVKLNHHLYVFLDFSSFLKYWLLFAVLVQAYHGHFPALQVLLESFMDIDIKDSNGRLISVCFVCFL